MPDVSGIHHVSVTVTDIERSVPWYSELLGLTKLMEEPHPDGTGYAVVLGGPASAPGARAPGRGGRA